MSMVHTRGGGIAKRRGGPRARVDRDGDLDMDAPSGRGGGGGRGRNGTRPRRGNINLNNHIPRGPAADRKPPGTSGSGSLASRVRDPRRDPVGTRSSMARGGRSNYAGPQAAVKVEGWKLSKGSAEECVMFLERKSKQKFIKTRKEGDNLIVYVPVAQVQSVLDWDNALFAGANLRITSDLTNVVDDVAMSKALPEKNETIDLLKQVLASRYKVDAKLLDLSHLGSDPILKSTGFFELDSTTGKMFPALMKIADNSMDNSAQKKREMVVSVSLANNGLSQVAPVSTLGTTFPDLKNLSLEGNRIADWKGLDNWRHRFRSLEQLVLIGNPITQLPGYKEEAMRRYPALTMLDNVLLDRPPVKVGGDEPRRHHTRSNAISAPAATQVNNRPIPLPVKDNFVTDPDVVLPFLSTFFGRYDTNREELLSAYYTPETYFSLSVNVSARRVESQQKERQYWDKHIPLSRNLTRVNRSQAYDRLARGLNEIRDLWAKLPPTRHDMSRKELWSFDSWPMEICAGITGMIIMVHGEFDEDVDGKVLKRSFDRTFIVRSGGPGGLQIMNEQLLYRAYGGIDAWRPEAPTNTTSQAVNVPTPTANVPVVNGVAPGAAPGVAQAVVPTVAPGVGGNLEAEHNQKIAMLAEKSGLTPTYAQMCLNETDWDLAKAWEAFQSAKNNGMLGPEAFAR